MKNVNPYTRKTEKPLRRADLIKEVDKLMPYVEAMKKSVAYGYSKVTEAHQVLQRQDKALDNTVLSKYQATLDTARADIHTCTAEVTEMLASLKNLPVRIKANDVNATILSGHIDRLQDFSLAYVKVTTANLVAMDTYVKLLWLQANPDTTIPSNDQQNPTTQPGE